MLMNFQIALLIQILPLEVAKKVFIKRNRLLNRIEFWIIKAALVIITIFQKILTAIIELLASLNGWITIQIGDILYHIILFFLFLLFLTFTARARAFSWTHGSSFRALRFLVTWIVFGCGDKLLKIRLLALLPFIDIIVEQLDSSHVQIEFFRYTLMCLNPLFLSFDWWFKVLVLLLKINKVIFEHKVTLL